MPNLVNPETLETSLIAVSSVMTAWSALFTAARLFANKRKLRPADYFVTVGFALSTTYTGLVLAMLKYARHQWDTPACWFTGLYMKLLFAQGILLGPAIFFTKSAIFLLYLQIFITGVHRNLQLAIYAGLALTFCTYWAGVPLEAYFAAPHAGQQWEELMLNGMPERLIVWGNVQGSLSVFLDVYIFALPLAPLARLRLSTGKRVGLLAVFATAMMGVVASVIALVFRVQLRHTQDMTWVQSCLFICVIVENNVAVIVSSMPAFATFLRVHVSESAFVKSLLSSSGRSGGSGSGGGSHFSARRLKTWKGGDDSETSSSRDMVISSEPPSTERTHRPQTAWSGPEPPLRGHGEQDVELGVPGRTWQAVPLGRSGGTGKMEGIQSTTSWTVAHTHPSAGVKPGAEAHAVWTGGR